jgi:hypothetical protein
VLLIGNMINQRQPILLVVHKARAAFCAAWASSGERTVVKLRPGPLPGPGHGSFLLLLNLKPFRLCAALKEGEILGSSDALILSVTTSIESDTVGRVRSDVFHRHEEA